LHSLSERKLQICIFKFISATDNFMPIASFTTRDQGTIRNARHLRAILMDPWFSMEDEKMGCRTPGRLILQVTCCQPKLPYGTAILHPLLLTPPLIIALSAELWL
jgi:hypothetical protein